MQLKNLASKVLFALSINFFNAVFNRISGKLQELSTSTEENPDYTDLELIQHINVDVVKLTRLLNGKEKKMTVFFPVLISCFQFQKQIKNSDY